MAIAVVSSALLPRQAGKDMSNLDYSSNSPRILAIVGTLTVLSGVLVALRCYVRLVLLRCFYVEDGVMVASMVCAAAVFACVIGESHHGLGQYNAAIFAGGEWQTLSIWTWSHTIIIVLGISLVKISVGFFLLRFATQKKYVKPFILGTLIFLVLFTTACLLTLILQCIPVQAAWNDELRLKKSTKCYSMDTYLKIGRFNSAINIITDFLYATLPVFMFYNLQAHRRTRASIMGILSLGYFACAAAIVKAVQQGQDEYRNANFYIWNSVELTIGIIAASFPTIKPLAKIIIGVTRTISGYGARTDGRKRTAGDGCYGPNSHALASLHRSGLCPEEQKYQVQIHANHRSISGSEEGRGSEENLNQARHAHTRGRARRRSSPLNTTRILQTTEVFVHAEVSGIGPKQTVEDRI